MNVHAPRPKRLPPIADGPPRPPAKPPRDVLDFLPDAQRIEKEPFPAAWRLVLFLLVALMIGAGTWAALSRTDIVVVGRGKVVTTARTVVVQPLETAIIRTLEVGVGDTVRKGQVLASLDPTFAAADVSQLEQRALSLTAQIERLQAEIDERDFAPRSQAPEHSLQAAIFAKRRAEFDAKTRAMAEQAAQIAAMLQTKKSDVELLGRWRDTLLEIEDMRASLNESNHGSKLNLLAARNDRLEVERQMNLARLQVAELEHERARILADRRAFAEEWRGKAMQELVAVRRERDAIAEQLRKAERRSQMVTLTAPVDAVVLETAERSVGSVIREAEPLFTLVPLDVPLELELMIPASEIGYVRAGQTVRVKLDALPFQKHGTLRGRLRHISADAFTSDKPERPGAFYKGQVEIVGRELRDVAGDFRLIPGMTVSGEIKVGERTIASYFLYPLTRAVDESLREP